MDLDASKKRFLKHFMSKLIGARFDNHIPGAIMYTEHCILVYSGSEWIKVA